MISNKPLSIEFKYFKKINGMKVFISKLKLIDFKVLDQEIKRVVSEIQKIPSNEFIEWDFAKQRSKQ